MALNRSNADTYFFIPKDFGTQCVLGAGAGRPAVLLSLLLHHADVMSPPQQGFQKHPKD